MRQLRILVLAIILSFFAFNSKAECNLIPSNNLQVKQESEEGITEKEFHQVLNEFEKVMLPIVKKEGYTLQINRKWGDDTVNANTTTEGNRWVINAFGGLARYSGMDADAFMMVMCHELGHHMGGFPAQGWASNEGQSDYYATSKCYRRMSYSKSKSLQVPSVVTEKCSTLHKSQEEINICEKGSMIGFTLASVLNSLSGSPKSLDFTTPDKNEVSKTNNAHPKAQCRLDTYFAGAVCGISYTEDFAKDNPIQGACAEEKGDKIGVRPHCWYKPR
jgi:hypothetical protein